MEDSFEYDKSAVDTDSESHSDTEFIDNSFVENMPMSTKKKNNTVFVAESEEYTDGNGNYIEFN